MRAKKAAEKTGDVGKTEGEKTEKQSTVTKVVCGGSSKTVEWTEGLTVGALAERYRATLNIPLKAPVFVNGKKSNYKTVVQQGDKVDFRKPAGKHA